VNETVKIRLLNSGPLPWFIQKNKPVALMTTRRAHLGTVEYEYVDEVDGANGGEQ